LEFEIWDFFGILVLRFEICQQVNPVMHLLVTMGITSVIFSNFISNIVIMAGPTSAVRIGITL